MHGEAPPNWYNRSDDIYAEAQRWELSNCMGESLDDMKLIYVQKHCMPKKGINRGDSSGKSGIVASRRTVHQLQYNCICIPVEDQQEICNNHFKDCAGCSRQSEKVHLIASNPMSE